MDNLYEYFSRFTNYIDFLTLKKIKIKEKYCYNLTLPISHLELVKNIKNKNFDNEINLEYFIEGIILLNSIDYKYKDIHTLNEILKELDADLLSLIFSKLQLNETNENTLLYNIILLRGYFILGYEDFSAYKIYIKQLIDYCNYIDINYKNILVNEINIILNKVSSKYSDDYLMKLLYGDFYAIEKNYIKANIYYNKSIKDLSDDKMIKIIKQKMKLIYPKVCIENVLDKVEKYRYDEALTLIENIINQNLNLDCEDLYWIGYSYNKLGIVEKSILYYEKSLELNADFLNIFIELGILYYKQNEFKKSLKICDKGLSIYRDNEILLFNKILIEIKLNLLDSAKKDIETILLYEDLDNSILNDILYIKSKYFVE